MVRTIHSKDGPTFDARGYFTKGDVETVANIPVIWSYGFSQGTKRGLAPHSMLVLSWQIRDAAF
ncbi:MAG: hypothetical protein U9Q07_09760 [Planctomycetota bacterium]|nr:hypothetical protein [Planctomycetota bacterium]